MAPKKRKRMNLPPERAAAHARVPCPACQKEVPFLFVNSHLDLDCPTLKSSLLSNEPPRPELSTFSVHADSNFGAPPPPVDILKPGNFRFEDSVSKSFPGSLEFDKGRPWKPQIQELEKPIVKGVTESKECDSQSDQEKESSDLLGPYFQDSPAARDHWWGTPAKPPLCDHERGIGATGASNLSITGSILDSNMKSVRHAEDCGEAAPGVKDSNATDIHKFPLSPLKLKAPRGLQVMENFITVEEEEHLLQCLDMDMSNPWKPSRINGIYGGKMYGNHVFGDLRRRVVSHSGKQIPKFLQPYVERMRERLPVLKDFFPNEMNAIDYRKVEGHYLKPHVDDRQLSGLMLVNLSLGGSCVMTYTRERGPQESFRIKLLRRSLQVVTGESRYSFTHGIQKDDILDPRRVSMTFRQSVEASPAAQPRR